MPIKDKPQVERKGSRNCAWHEIVPNIIIRQVNVLRVTVRKLQMCDFPEPIDKHGVGWNNNEFLCITAIKEYDVLISQE